MRSGNTTTSHLYSPASDGEETPQYASPSDSLYSSMQSSKEDMVILVMGPTGTGKSTFINIAAGFEAAPVGHGLALCTSQVQEIRCRHPQLDCDVVFVDTPGFDDTNIQNSQKLESVVTWLSQSYRKGTKLAGILYFHRISDVRLSNSILSFFCIFQKLCGEDVFDKVILVTTHWDSAHVEEERQREQLEYELRKYLWKDMLNGGSQMRRFQHNSTSAWNIVNALTENEKRKVLRIQAEIVGQRLYLGETAAGRALLSWNRDLANQTKGFVRRLEFFLQSVRSRNTLSDRVLSELKRNLARSRMELDAVAEWTDYHTRITGSLSNPSLTSETTGSVRSSPSLFNPSWHLIKVSDDPEQKFHPRKENGTQDYRSRNIADISIRPTIHCELLAPPKPSTFSTITIPCYIPNPKSLAEVATCTEYTLEARSFTTTIQTLEIALAMVNGIPIPELQIVASVAIHIVRKLNCMTNTDPSLIALAADVGMLVRYLCDHVKLGTNLPEVVAVIDQFTRELLALLRIVSKKDPETRWILQPFDQQVIMDCSNAIKLVTYTLDTRLQLPVTADGKKVGEKRAEELAATAARIEDYEAQVTNSMHHRGSSWR